MNKNKELQKSLIIIGNQDYKDFSSIESFMCSILDDGAHAEAKKEEHDCLVAVSSSSLLNKNVTLSIISNKNHVTEKDNILDYSNLILNFLNDNPDSVLASDSYAYYNPKTGYKKNFNYNEGSVQLKLIENKTIWNINSNNDLEIERISTKEKFKLTRNTYSKNYFHFNRESGKIDSFYTIPQGEYRLIIPIRSDHPILHFIIKPMETNFLEINLDDLCNVNVLNTSWSEWTNISCLKNDKMNQSRFYIQYDSNNCGKISNKTIFEYRSNQSCDYCKPSIYGPFYTEWSSCSNSIISNRTKFYLDLNYNNCCLITNLDSDCIPIKNLTYQNVSEIKSCESPIIHNPKDGDIFSYRKILINVSTGVVVKFIKYQLDGKISRNGQPIYIDLCNNKNCSHVEKYLPLADGNHTLGVISINNDNRQFEDSVNFLIDSKKPQIKKTYPKLNSYINNDSLFIAEFVDENPSLIELYINGERVSYLNLTKDDDNAGFKTPLDKYDGQIIYYYFSLEDIAGNRIQSKPVKVHVDTSPPIINNPSSFYKKEGNYIRFNLSISEANFKSVDYIDNSELKAKWKNICSSLKNKIYCDKKVYFKSGSYNLTIRVLDKAGNSVEKNVVFN